MRHPIEVFDSNPIEVFDSYIGVFVPARVTPFMGHYRAVNPIELESASCSAAGKSTTSWEMIISSP